jgi:acyl carrier protein
VNKDDIKNAVQDIMRDVLDDPSLIINGSMTAADIDNWDSLAHISIITAIEKSLRIRFSLSEIDAFSAVGDLVDGIEKKLR